MGLVRQGQRQLKAKQRKELKGHMSLYKAITTFLDELAKYLVTELPDVEFTEENINEYAKPHFPRDLDNIETYYLLSKIHGYKGNTTES